MPGPNDNHSSYTSEEWLAVALYPVAKGALVIPTQPLARIAATQQKSVTQPGGALSFAQAAKNIFRTQGFMGFTQASTPAAAREVLKSSYKGVLQVEAIKLATRWIPGEDTFQVAARGMATGTMVAIPDTLLGQTVERYKTWSITQGTKTNIFKFLNVVWNQQNGRPIGFAQELYRGAVATAAKATLMNGALFIGLPYANQFVAPYKNDFPLLSKAGAAFLAGGAAALVGAPMDIAKLHAQKQTGEKKPIFVTLRNAYRASGFKGLFAGMPAKFSLIVTGYALNAGFINFFNGLQKPTLPPTPPNTPTERKEEDPPICPAPPTTNARTLLFSRNIVRKSELSSTNDIDIDIDSDNDIDEMCKKMHGMDI